jgi:hypothetical protein
MIALPLINFLKSEKSDTFLLRIESYLQKKWAVLSYIILLIVIQAALLPIFPEETHALIDDWTFFTYYLAFFVAGMLTASSDKIWQVLEKQRRFHLLVALISLALLEGFMTIDWAVLQSYLFADVRILWQITEIVVAWTWVITIIGYGRHYLNRNSKILKYANEGIYPFYILHQTVIIAVAFPMTEWNLDIGSKFLLLSSVSFLLTVLIYQIFIRPFNCVRVLFGMKVRKMTEENGSKNISKAIRLNSK